MDVKKGVMGRVKRVEYGEEIRKKGDGVRLQMACDCGDWQWAVVAAGGGGKRGLMI